MLTSSNLLHLPFTPDLIEGGLHHTIRSLPNLLHNGATFERLRERVASAAVELAFRRHLSEHEIPYEVRGAVPFTDPDRYDVMLGGHRCDLHSFFIKERSQIARMRQDPCLLLHVPALIASDQHAAEGLNDHDLYLFAFLAGLTATSIEELKRVQEANQPTYFLHVLSGGWARPQVWSPLGPLALKSESDETLTVELNGQTEGREFLSRTVELPPRTRVLVQDPFFALTSVHIPRLFEGRLGIHSPRRKEPYIIQRSEWGNLWVYGMQIVLAGYVTRREFRQRASQIQAGEQVFQYRQTPEKHLAMPIVDLNPLGELFMQVREWESARK
jgi:hypothetical protein